MPATTYAIAPISISGIITWALHPWRSFAMDRAIKIVRAIFPRAKPEYLAAFEAGDAQLTAAGITKPLRLAHLLAQCGAESGGLTLARESLNYATEGRLQQVFDNMRLTKPLMPGEV